MQIDLLCPVENQGVIVKTNSKTGEPYALFKLFNLSEQVIQAVAFTVHAYDAYGGELGSFRVDLSELNGQPKEHFAAAKAISLAKFAEAKHVTLEILEVHFEEGDPYINEGNYTEVKITEPDYDEKIRLMAAAGEDAEAYAQDTGLYWLCVCGRPNREEAACCVRCGREKEEVMEHFSSRDAISKTLADLEVAQQQAEEEKRLAEEQQKLAKRKKRQKAALLSAAGIVAAAILCVLIYFIYGGIMTLAGNSAAKNGDYLSAYSRYAAVGNSAKLATVSEEVRGNSGSNLNMSGLLADDEENLYYLDPMCSIYKESKKTGEKARLGDAEGLCLNVMDGWVYYLDAMTGQAVYRISTDGAAKEVVYETEDSYFGGLTLVGNELYFVLQEPRDDLTPELQEQIAQQGSGDIYQYRLYRLKVGAKKPERVSEQEIIQFAYYKDRFYYTDRTDYSLYSMNRKGGDIQKLVSGPVYGFDANDDSLYYLDGTADETTGQPKLALVRAGLDGSYIEDAVEGKMIIGFGFDGSEMNYLTYTDTGSTELYKKSADGDELLAEGSQLFNQKDGYLLYVNNAGQFMKSTYDKSGFEEVEITSLSTGEETDSSTEAAE